MRHETSKPRGILNTVNFNNNELVRYLPSADLAKYIEHYWIVNWNFEKDKSYVAETLPHPSVHIVFEKGNSKIFGVMSQKFTKTLKGKGTVFGIKFNPGAFYAFYKNPVINLSNKQIDISEIFKCSTDNLEKQIFSSDDLGKIEIVEKFLNELEPAFDERITLLFNIIKMIDNDKQILKVEDIVEKTEFKVRQLQRLFNQYVGVSPKWIIKRYRLLEAVEMLKKSKKINWAELSVDLGYFDQAHFIKDFKSIIGRTPLEFEKAVKQKL